VVVRGVVALVLLLEFPRQLRGLGARDGDAVAELLGMVYLLLRGVTRREWTLPACARSRSLAA
jgi:hypothetical protein